MDERHRILRIQSEGGVRGYEVRDFLSALDYAYNGVVIFQRTLDALPKWRISPDYMPLFPLYNELHRHGTVASKGGRPIFLSGKTFESLVGRTHRLTLVRVRLESPGSWDVAGFGAAL